MSSKITRPKNIIDPRVCYPSVKFNEQNSWTLSFVLDLYIYMDISHIYWNMTQLYVDTNKSSRCFQTTLNLLTL